MDPPQLFVFLCAFSSLLRYGGSMSLQSAMSVRFNSTGTQLLALRRRLPPVLYELHSRLPSFQFDNQGYFNSCTMKSCCFAGDKDQVGQQTVWTFLKLSCKKLLILYTQWAKRLKTWWRWTRWRMAGYFTEFSELRSHFSVIPQPLQGVKESLSKALIQTFA